MGWQEETMVQDFGVDMCKRLADMLRKRANDWEARAEELQKQLSDITIANKALRIWAEDLTQAVLATEKREAEAIRGYGTVEETHARK